MPSDLVDRFMALVHTEPNTGCWLWGGTIGTKGYGRISIHNRLFLAHRVSWSIFNARHPEHLCVLHSCDVPWCVNPTHLFLGTVADNNRDMRMKGRGANPPLGIGSRNGQAILDETAVARVKTRLRSGESGRAIAADEGVSPSAVWLIKHGKKWRHLA